MKPLLALLLLAPLSDIAASPSSSCPPAPAVAAVEVSVSVARALANCKCKTTAYINPSNWVPQPCGQVACLGFAAEILNTVHGDCPQIAEVCPGPATNCSGDLKVTITSSSSDCCVGQVPGGYGVPTWGAGCTLMGNSRDHTYTGLTKLCANTQGSNDKPFDVKHCNGNTIVTVTASLVCGACDTTSNG